LKDADEKIAQENYRLLYVAATRAKKSLTIIGAEKMLPQEWLSHFVKQGKINGVAIPKVLHIETGLSDVKLGHLLENEKNKNRVRYVQSKLEILSLQSNVGVSFSQEFRGYNTNLNGRLLAAFSDGFSKKCIAYLQKYGYNPTAAILSQVVRWTSEDGQETWVPLFRVEFAKNNLSVVARDVTNH
jgi:ATP-dependent DNA helicase RecQ